MVKIGGNPEKHKLIKKRKLNENRGKFLNFVKIEGFRNFFELGGICKMHHRLMGIDVLTFKVYYFILIKVQLALSPQKTQMTSKRSILTRPAYLINRTPVLNQSLYAVRFSQLEIRTLRKLSKK